jgi:hypothetical protein
MESADFNKKTLITEVQPGIDDDSDTDIESEFSEEEAGDDKADKNQYFHVVDAEPPTNYDDPYSTLPPKVVSRLDIIKVSEKRFIFLVERHCAECQNEQRRGGQGIRTVDQTGALQSPHLRCLLVIHLQRIQEA